MDHGETEAEHYQPGPRPVEHGEDRQCIRKLDQDQVQWINWEHTGRKGERRSKGKDGGNPKSLCSTCEQGCCGQSILAVASWDKHIALNSISFILD